MQILLVIEWCTLTSSCAGYQQWVEDSVANPEPHAVDDSAAIAANASAAAPKKGFLSSVKSPVMPQGKTITPTAAAV